MWHKKIKLPGKVLLSSILWQILLLVRLKSAVWEDGFVIPWFIRMGLIPYRDFSMGTYLPFPKLMMLVIDSLFAWNLYVTIFAALALAIANLWFIYRLSKKYLKGTATVVPMIFYSIWSGYLLQQNVFEINLFVSFLTLISFSLFLDYLNKPSFWKAFFVGMVLTLGIFSQQMVLLPTLIVVGFMIWESIKNKSGLRQLLLQVLLPLTLSAIVISAPQLIWIAKLGVFPQMLFETVTYYLGGGGYPFNTYLPSSYLFMLLALNIPFLILTLLTLKKLNSEEKLRALPLLLINFSYLVVNFVAVMHPRRFLSLLPLCALMAGMVYDKLHIELRIKHPVYLLLTLFFLGYVTIKVIPWYATAIKKGPGSIPIYNVHYPGDNVYNAIQWIKKNTPPDARVFSFETTISYFEMQRLPAINRTYILPWDFEPYAELQQLWQKNPPQYCFISELMFGRFKNLGYEKQIKFLRQSLDKDYTKAASFDWMTIYVKKN